MTHQRLGVLRLRSVLAVAALAPLALVSAGIASTAGAAPAPAVDCDAGGTIAGALAGLQPNETLKVSGTCEESVHIPRRLTGVVLDGQGGATIQGPSADAPATSPAAFTVFVEATGVTLRGFTVLGGSHAVHLSGPATAVIENNVIRGSGGAIHLDKESIGQILGNTIEGNKGYGINLQEDSYARIGFKIPTLPKPVPNIIRDNAGPGIIVTQRSSAWIAGNTITGNKGDGVFVDRLSQADVVANTISGNTGDGVSARHGSGVNLSAEGTPLAFVAANESAEANGGVGIRCEIGGYVAGPRGSLAGRKGAVRVDRSCADGLTRGRG